MNWSYVPSVKMQTSLFLARDHSCFQMFSLVNMRLLYTPENTEHHTQFGHWIPKSFYYTHFTWLCCSLSKTLKINGCIQHTHISIIHISVSLLSMQQSLSIEATQLSSTSISYSLQSCGFLLFSMVLFKVVNKTRNGTEWKKLIKHETELLSLHKVRLRTHGSQSYTHANCSCTHVQREASG